MIRSIGLKGLDAMHVHSDSCGPMASVTSQLGLVIPPK